MDARRRLPPLVLEPTDKTGLRHLDAVISMAHGEDEDSANGNFSIMVGANRSLDAKGSYRGYAAFGKVVAGMDVVTRMLALPPGGGRGAMSGQMIIKPVRLIQAVRLVGSSDARRVGNAFVSKGRFRWSPSLKKQQHITII